MNTYSLYCYDKNNGESYEFDDIPSELNALNKKKDFEKNGLTVNVIKKTFRQLNNEIVRLFNEICNNNGNDNYHGVKINSLLLKINDSNHCPDNFNLDSLGDFKTIFLDKGNIVLYANCVCLVGNF